MISMFDALEKVRLDAVENHLPNKKICYKLKLLTIFSIFNNTILRICYLDINKSLNDICSDQ